MKNRYTQLLIDIFEVIDEFELSEIYNQKTNNIHLFKRMLKIFEYATCLKMGFLKTIK